MKFKEIRDMLTDLDHHALTDWEARENDWMLGRPGIEERLSFAEFRYSILAGGVAAILNELIAREQSRQDA